MRKPILLALNIPFCPCRCTYCDKGCNVIGDLQVLDQYADALMREVEDSAHQYDDCQVKAVWIGGGIAGHLFDEKLELLLRRMRCWFPFAPNPEITLKVHPGMVSTQTLAAIRRGGVTRLSIDYVTANSFEAAPLGRYLPSDAMDVTQMVLAGAPVAMSFDILTGLPAQTPGTIEQTLEKVLAYGARHISLIPLRIAPGTPFAEKWVKENAGSTALRRHLPDQAECETILGRAECWLREHGFRDYLPGEYALPGEECTYLRMKAEGCEELAFGAGAVTSMDGVCSRNIRAIGDYCRFSPDPQRLTQSIEVIG
ncbi:MAG: radical SAM protein [Faecousia sp.]